jgi:DNA-binding LacI/PurR family transcriptional regulator
MKAPKTRAPSIRDVARVAEVSYQTVSRVLNDHPSIRDSTRARVIQVMKDLNYRPNRAARDLSRGRSRIIGVLSGSSVEYGPASSMAAIQDAGRDAGYLVNIANITDDTPESIQGALDHLLNQGVEGIVVLAPQKRVLAVLQQLFIDVPFVTLQATGHLENHAFSVDQIAGAKLATKHLIDLGHRRIFHLAGPQNWIEAEARMHGFLEEMRAQNISTTAPILGDWTAHCGFHIGRELLRMRDFTAIFSSNDQMALGLVHAMHEAGMNIPGDVSIVGFDDIPEAAHFWPPLTTVRQDFAELGRRCITVLLAEIAGDGALRPGSLVPELIIRSSTAPPSF